MTQTIMFPRGKVFIVANIINVVIEPLGNSRQVVFFCIDKGGRKYRVPKSEVVSIGTQQKVKEKARKKHGRKTRAI